MEQMCEIIEVLKQGLPNGAQRKEKKIEKKLKKKLKKIDRKLNERRTTNDITKFYETLKIVKKCQTSNVER